MKKLTKVLVVIDAQVDFITGALRNEEAIKAVPNIVKKINDFDGDYILVTMDTHDENYLESKEGKKLPVKHCVKGTKGWQLQEDIKKALIEHDAKEGKNVMFFQKPTFGSTSMAEFIELDEAFEGELDIEIIGFVSSICVISNALLLKTFLFDRADISVDTKCIAGLNKENNDSAIEVMKSCQINIINK